jgi:hypothetical protein
MDLGRHSHRTCAKLLRLGCGRRVFWIMIYEVFHNLEELWSTDSRSNTMDNKEPDGLNFLSTHFLCIYDMDIVFLRESSDMHVE